MSQIFCLRFKNFRSLLGGHDWSIECFGAPTVCCCAAIVGCPLYRCAAMVVYCLKLHLAKADELHMLSKINKLGFSLLFFVFSPVLQSLSVRFLFSWVFQWFSLVFLYTFLFFVSFLWFSGFLFLCFSFCFFVFFVFSIYLYFFIHILYFSYTYKIQLF